MHHLLNELSIGPDGPNPAFAGLVDACVRAADRIMDVYRSGDFEVSKKSDESPLTAADRQAHDVVTAYLARELPDIPVISEEDSVRASIDPDRDFFLLDPLDGTKEFVSRNGDFTVNLALVSGHYPVLGIIVHPPTGDLYCALAGQGTWKLDGATSARAASPDRADATADDPESVLAGDKRQAHAGNRAWRRLSVQKAVALRVLASRHHAGPETDAYVASLAPRFPRLELIQAGSSLKFCRIAEGRADLYPRFAPTMEWDTAAGQIVLEEAGGEVVEAEGGNRMYYGRGRDWLNPWFIARSTHVLP